MPKSDGLAAVLKLLGFLALARELLLPWLLLLLLKKPPAEKVGTNMLDRCCCCCCLAKG